ncbi:hypothetical protein KI387_036228 [Taxus chinensis]|uniref:Uncharacterized protein n=1 Tax=Taxus chinensis TaxID=29808 RepID=A0AA38L2C1_TAXCH|nr:hypothetical protein KI387_036228 [Taxus chinensis]
MASAEAAAESAGSPTSSTSTSFEEVTPNPLSPSIRSTNIALQDLSESRADLLGRIHNLKKDLQEWRGKLDTQVKTYREELGDLKSSLNLEVEQLKSEFEDLRKSLRKQLDDATNIGSMIPGLDKKLEESVPDLMKNMDLNKVDEPDS